MENKIHVTTTGTIETAEIIKYLNIVNSNIVLGTNVVSDFSASITDFFGGYSDTYQSKLDKIYKIAIDRLKNDAKSMGANAIIGLKLDFDEISGKGKAMFMVSAVGTAVVIKFNKQEDIKKETDINLVSCESLESKMMKSKIKLCVKNRNDLDEVQWQYIIENPIEECYKVLLENYIDSLNKEQRNEYRGPGSELLIKYFPMYSATCDKSLISDLLYEQLSQNSSVVFKLIKKNRLFSVQNIKNLVKEGNLGLASKCLTINKDSYDHEDLLNMEDLLSLFEKIPELGKVEEVKSLLSSSKKRFICRKGHSNSLDSEFCATCGENIKGLTSLNVVHIEEFKERVAILRSMLS